MPFINEFAGVALALLPAGCAYWWGRKLAATRAAPMLPERLQKTRGQIASSVLIVCILLAILVPWSPVYIVLCILATARASFSARRQLLAERWSFARSFWVRLRTIVGFIGPLMLVGFAPVLAYIAGDNGWIVSALVAIFYLAVFLDERTIGWLLLARPLDNPSLEREFAEVVRKSSVPTMPGVKLVGDPDWHFANAFAIHASRANLVVFTDHILTILDPEEVTTIFAHEIGHLELFERRSWKASRVAWLILNLVYVLATPILASAYAWPPPLVFFVCPTFLVIVVVLITRSNKKIELYCDRRAAELTGKPEAFARALTRLYDANLLPHRLSAAAESQSSHPSLQTRVREVGGAAEPAYEPIDAPVLVASATPGAYVVFDRDAIEHHAGAAASAGEIASPTIDDVRRSASKSLRRPYDSLAGLYLETSTSSFFLSAFEITKRLGLIKRIWRVPVRPDDVIAVERLIDRTGIQNVAGRFAMTTLLHLVVSLLACLLLTAPGMPRSLVFVVGYSLFQRNRRAQIINALTFAAGLLLTSISPSAFGESSKELVAAPRAAFLIVTFACSLGAWLTPKSDAGRTWPAFLVFLFGATLAWSGPIYVLAHAPAPIDVYHAFRSRPGCSLIFIAIAALFATARQPALRWATCLPALVALIPVTLTSEWYQRRYAEDPWFINQPAIDAPRAAAELLDYKLSSWAWGVRISPDGAKTIYIWHDNPTQIEIAEFGQAPFATLDGFSASFLSNDHLLLLRYEEGASEPLALVAYEIRGAASPPRELGRRTLPTLTEPSIQSVSARTWIVEGWDIAGKQFCRVPGSVDDLLARLGDGANYETTTWSMSASSEYERQSTVAGSGGVAVSILEAQAPPLEGVERVFVKWLVPEYWRGRQVAEIHAPTGPPRTIASTLAITALDGPAGSPPIVLADDGSQTYVWRIGADRLTPICVIAGSTHASAIGEGPMLALFANDGRLIVIDLSGREPTAWTHSIPDENWWAYNACVQSRFVAGAARVADASMIFRIQWKRPEPGESPTKK